jgi:acyl-CoA hydrolase
MPEILDDVGNCVDAVLRRIGPRIVLALPLGIGKPNPLVNEFYRRAARDRTLDLTIITALSLLKPVAHSALERRLVEPLAARIFGSYVEPEYARALQANALPANIRVIEFFLTPGAFLNCPPAQHNYLSANYTHVAREVMARGVNVIAHLVARRTLNGQLQLSLGSNPDVTVDLLPRIEQARREGRDIVMIGETHAQMPFMAGQAQLEPERFDYLVDHPRYDYDLFGPPNAPLAGAEHAIGLYASALVSDGGTLQVGIGELGDALIYALLLRHQQNEAWRGALAALAAGGAAECIAASGGEAPFTHGLFAASEMFVDQLLELYRAGVLRRRVYDSLPIERLLAAGEPERFDATLLPKLLAAGVGPLLNEAQFTDLKRHGVFREEVEFSGGRVRPRGGQWITADLSDAASCTRMAAECLGRELRNGQVLRTGFFWDRAALRRAAGAAGG